MIEVDIPPNQSRDQPLVPRSQKKVLTLSHQFRQGSVPDTLRLDGSSATSEVVLEDVEFCNFSRKSSGDGDEESDVQSVADSEGENDELVTE